MLGAVCLGQVLLRYWPWDRCFGLPWTQAHSRQGCKCPFLLFHREPPNKDEAASPSQVPADSCNISWALRGVRLPPAPSTPKHGARPYRTNLVVPNTILLFSVRYIFSLVLRRSDIKQKNKPTTSTLVSLCSLQRIDVLLALFTSVVLFLL